MIQVILFLLITQGQNSDFLRLPVFSRPSALGSAYTSVSDDAAAIFYNPAGINSTQTSINLTEWLMDTRFSAIASSYKIKKFISVGIGIYYFSYGSIDRYDENGERLGSFSPYDIMTALSLTKTIGQCISFGISGKVFSQNIFETKNTSFEGDVGVKFTFPHLTIGENIKNFLNPNNSYANLGFSLQPIKNLLMTAELFHFTNLELRAGVEYEILPMIFRMGINNQKLCFGIGYKQKNFSFDYAAINFPDLGLIHEFSIGLGIK